MSKKLFVFCAILMIIGAIEAVFGIFTGSLLNFLGGIMLCALCLIINEIKERKEKKTITNSKNKKVQDSTP